MKRIELMQELRKSLAVQMQERKKQELIEKHNRPALLEKNIQPGPGAYVVKPEVVPGGRCYKFISAEEETTRRHEAKLRRLNSPYSFIKKPDPGIINLVVPSLLV